MELAPPFRSQIYVKRGSYVVVDTAAFEERGNKLGGEIVNVVREERRWRGMGWWPSAWKRVDKGLEELMPPSVDLSDEGDGEGGGEGGKGEEEKGAGEADENKGLL